MSQPSIAIAQIEKANYKAPHLKTVARANEYHHQVRDLLALMPDNGVQFRTPAKILTGITKIIGWKLEFPQLPAGRRAERDRNTRTIPSHERPERPARVPGAGGQREHRP